MKNYFIKTTRAFTPIRKYAWIFTVLVALGGLWQPKLGLLVVLIMAGLTGTAFFNGRYWCGNFCPHGSLFDVLITPISQNRKIPKFLKSKTMISLFFVFFMFNFSRKVLNVTTLWGNYDFFDKLGFVFVTTYLMVMVVGGLFALLVNPRTWCQFCPMGTLQKLSYRVGKTLGIAKKTEKKITACSIDQCHACGKCARVCPFQLTPYLEFSENNQFDNINCIKCSTCVENCPAGILSLETEEDAIKLKEDSSSVHGYESRQQIEAEISNIIDLGNGIKEYVFSFQKPNKVHYKAGQFILIKIQDNPKQYRAYSISSYNEDSTALRVIIKKIEKGHGTDIIFNQFKIGDTIELEGPMGDELVPSEDTEKVLFIGNGIGITPFIALSKDMVLNHKSAKEVKLLYGQRYEHEFLYHEYFNELDKNNDIFEYHPVASRPDNQDTRKGYVTDLIKEMSLEGYKVYMCGSKNMIQDSYNILVEKGVRKEDIFYESEEKIKL
ncbi:4Fe-4S binding protein [Serpentinicella sp. ANB-PHB4]|uniref:4Fe-4S binding protein n=1 Tax=Serpentinicella sp. ANB-PHB4 TaxID=3074076 RepID=UPI00285CE0B2|nr:4Fe-4S binding protein [Serpentinicella sp. ANB-PHB4]MDR5658458.1 4Fe-4S binding protein [Serpentinicella sp. ANB-PHB4]